MANSDAVRGLTVAGEEVLEEVANEDALSSAILRRALTITRCLIVLASAALNPSLGVDRSISSSYSSTLSWFKSRSAERLDIATAEAAGGRKRTRRRDGVAQREELEVYDSGCEKRCEESDCAFGGIGATKVTSVLVRFLDAIVERRVWL